MSRVTVIIPNYNGLKFMGPCMSALKAQTYTDFCVLIVDNGSTDGSAEWIRSLTGAGPSLTGDGPENSASSISSPMSAHGILRGHIGSMEVNSILLSENTGFAGAVNVGISHADSELLLLLNNDTEPEPDFIAELVRAFDEEAFERASKGSASGRGRLFAASPKMIQLYHKELLDDAGDGYNLLGWAFQRGVGQPVDEAKFSRRTSVFSACAGASMYMRDLLMEIAYSPEESFDTAHFAYLEDLDLSFRARIRGYDIRYIPEARVYHVGSGTSGSKYNQFKVRLAARNNIWLNWKNMPLLMLLINLPGILMGILIKLMFFIRIGFGRDYLKGLREGIAGIPKLRKVGFKPENLGNYALIELRLIADTFSYVGDFLRRRMKKR